MMNVYFKFKLNALNNELSSMAETMENLDKKSYSRDYLLWYDHETNRIKNEIETIEEDSKIQTNLINVVAFNNHLEDNHLSESLINRYFVKASCSSEAIKTLHNYRILIDDSGSLNEYDCSGEWLCYPVKESQVKWSNTHKCYIVPVYWILDV